VRIGGDDAMKRKRSHALFSPLAGATPHRREHAWQGNQLQCVSLR
jgi:hypothetical protein